MYPLLSTTVGHAMECQHGYCDVYQGTGYTHQYPLALHVLRVPPDTVFRVVLHDMHLSCADTQLRHIVG